VISNFANGTPLTPKAFALLARSRFARDNEERGRILRAGQPTNHADREQSKERSAVHLSH
jgi:hypothetical protein